MQNTFIDKAGKHRIGIVVVCLQCGLQFTTRKSQPAKFCCRNCKNKYQAKINQEKRPVLKCAWCNIEFQRPHKTLSGSKSGLYFCCRKCKDNAQRIGGIKEIMPPHYGTHNEDACISTSIYRSKFEEHELVCFRCGYKEFASCVAIHHIDKNRNNNDKKNLIPLCNNCHKALHYGYWKLEELNMAR